jgi:tetratricopeptide (TPR) repeat protein
VGGVFISYRSEDSHSYAALIYAELCRRFGDDQVFLDSESTAAGEDFGAVLFGRLRQCRVLLVVIGQRWLSVTDEAGRRRIDCPEDWVRRELVEAFAHGLRVIPILTDGAQIPAEADLPADIAALHRRQALRLHHRNTSHDLARIVEELPRLEPDLAAAAQRHRQGVNPVPQQLPPAPRMFAARREELARLTAALDETAESGRTVVISAIAGAGGIGKTWLALHWAHQQVERFPDGQLFVNLRGFDPSGEPISPGVAVRGFLDAFGVDPGRIPVDLDAQAGLYRSLVAGKQMLIMLDNARDTIHIVPLLPGSPTCTVLVTSRDQLSGLVTAQGAHRLVLDALDEHEARDLLIRRLGRERIQAEPDAVAELLTYCAGLPLALTIVASRAQAHPDFPLSAVAAKLRDEATRLGALDEGDPASSLPAVLSWSYRNLDAEHARVFGLLSITPGPDISLSAAASLTALPPAQASTVLQALERASLVDEPVPGRYRMHDLIRLYAAERAHHDQPEDGRDAALRRLVDFYLHTAYTGERLLDPHRQPIEISSPAACCHPYPLPDQAAALAWFEAEHSCLLASQRLAANRGWHSAVWQLAWTLSTFHQRRGYLHDDLAVWQAGLVAAQHGDDPATVLRIHRGLGQTYAHVGRHADALDHLGRALTLAQDTGDLLAQAHTHHALAVAWEQQEEDPQALEHATSALHLYQALDQPIWEAEALNLVGWYSARLGHYQQARTHCQAALTLARHHHHRAGEANTLDSLGYLAHRTGQHDQALDYYQQALILFRDLGDAYAEADVLDHLGQTHAALGHYDQACDMWHQALRLYEDQYRVNDAQRVQTQLDELIEGSG